MTIEDQGKKQAGVLQSLRPKQQLKLIKDLFLRSYLEEKFIMHY